LFTLPLQMRIWLPLEIRREKYNAAFGKLLSEITNYFPSIDFQSSFHWQSSVSQETIVTQAMMC